MGLIKIEKGDTVATKEGKQVRVMAMYYNGDVLSKIEGIDDSEDTPMRRPVWSSQIARVLKKVEQPVEAKKEGK